MSYLKEMLALFWMVFWTMAGLLMHLALFMVGAWVSYEVPDIDRDTRTGIFLGWMVMQVVIVHYINKAITR